ncbi:recA-like protein [Altererythrobacter lutimaris]|uniref:recA-like protein n=1 Tax=Altererythrobacter lutimaris TaxID=2743979 RepID=UPI001E4ED0D0|nr:recA-like protein [Altererythrobacter lutimaris]
MSLAQLSASCDLQPLSALAADAASAQRWRPGLAAPQHSEVFAKSGDASGAGLALALACDALALQEQAAKSDPLAPSEDTRSVLWVQDRAAIRLNGRPYRAGLPDNLQRRIIHVDAETPEDALFALEEGLRCRDLMFVIGEIAGNPRALDFTASRRLSLTAEQHGVPLWLVRLDAQSDLSSARMRWRAAAHPSSSPRWNSAAPGAPAWQAELFRARSHPPGQWILRNDEGRLVADRPDNANDEAEPVSAPPYHGDLARPTVGRSLAAL